MNEAFCLSVLSCWKKIIRLLRNLPLGAETGPACAFVNEKATLKNSAEKKTRHLSGGVAFSIFDIALFQFTVNIAELIAVPPFVTTPIGPV